MPSHLITSDTLGPELGVNVIYLSSTIMYSFYNYSCLTYYLILSGIAVSPRFNDFNLLMSTPLSKVYYYFALVSLITD